MYIYIYIYIYIHICIYIYEYTHTASDVAFPHANSKFKYVEVLEIRV